MPELSPIFALADRHIAESAALDPFSATSRGIGGFDQPVDRLFTGQANVVAQQCDRWATDRWFDNLVVRGPGAPGR